MRKFMPGRTVRFKGDDVKYIIKALSLSGKFVDLYRAEDTIYGPEPEMGRIPIRLLEIVHRPVRRGDVYKDLVHDEGDLYTILETGSRGTAITWDHTSKCIFSWSVDAALDAGEYELVGEYKRIEG